MEFVHVGVTISFPCVVDIVPVCDPTYERPRISGEGMDVEPVDTD